MIAEQPVSIRPFHPRDLDAVNAVIAACIAEWDLPERVKRLSLASYRYSAQDLDHFGMMLAETDEEAVGIAAWETANPADTPGDEQGLLLHGLYVRPGYQRRGIGSRLVDAALVAAREAAMGGLLVKAQTDAVAFFISKGFAPLPIAAVQRDYPHRYWHPV